MFLDPSQLECMHKVPLSYNNQNNNSSFEACYNSRLHKADTNASLLYHKVNHFMATMSREQEKTHRNDRKSQRLGFLESIFALHTLVYLWVFQHFQFFRSFGFCISNILYYSSSYISCRYSAAAQSNERRDKQCKYAEI